MWRRAVATFVVLALAGGSAQARSIDGSSVVTPSPRELCEQTPYLFEFQVFNGSPDDEWLATIEITFPDGFVITPETASIEEGFSGPWAFDFSVVGTNPQTAVWSDADGEFGEIWAGDGGTFSVEATSPVVLSDLSLFAWVLTGDDWGGPPHSVAGEVGIPLCTTATERPTWGRLKTVYR